MQDSQDNSGAALEVIEPVATDQAYEQNWLVWLAKVRILILTFLLGIELAASNLTTTPINRRQFVVVIGFCYAVSALLAYIAAQWRDSLMHAWLQILTDLGMATALVYATGGVAFAGFEAGWASVGGPAQLQVDKSTVGWVAGGGIERMFTRNWSARAEFLHYGLGKKTVASTTGANTYTTAFRHDVSVVRLGISYRP